MTLTAGTFLGPYQIIGAGGMGEVYRASDVRLGRDVAIKVLPERRLNDRQALARFERETRALAALSHPNVLAIFDVGSSGTVGNAVMELLEREPLRTRIERAPIAWQRAVEIAVVIADGLAAAQREEAFRWLQAAVDDRSWRIAWLPVDPLLDPLRPDRRFRDMLANVKGAPPPAR